MSGAEEMMAPGDTPAEPSAPESSRPDDGGLSLDSPSEEGFPEGDDILAPEKQDDEGEGEMEKYWLRIEPLPPRFGYIQIKKLTRDLLGSDRDLITGESNNDKRYALICMNSKNVAERLLHKVRGHRPLPGAPALEAEMYSDAEREQRFGSLQAQQRTLQSSVSLAERQPNASNGGGRRFVLVRRLSQDAKSFAWFRRFPTSTGMKKGQVWGHRGGPRWAALECYSEEEAHRLAKELDGFKAPEASEALSTEVVSRHAIEEEERAVKQKYEGASGRRPQHYDDRRNERFRRSHGRDARRDNRDPREEERHRGRGGYDARRNEDRRPDERHDRRPERKDERHEGDRRDYGERRRHDERQIGRRPEELPRRTEERWDQRRPDSYREDHRRGHDARDGRDGRRHEEARRDERDRWYQGDRNYDRQHGGPSGRSRSQREQRDYRREHERRSRPEDSRERAHRHEERGRDAESRNAPSHAQQHQQHAGHASRSRSANANAIARKEARAAFAEAESRAQAAEEMCLQKQKEAQMAAERSSKCKGKFQEVLANMEKKKSQAKALGADADQKMREAEMAAREAHLAEVDVEKYKDYVMAAEQDANEANIETAKCAKEAAVAKEEASKLRGLVGKMMIQDEDL